MKAETKFYRKLKETSKKKYCGPIQKLIRKADEGFFISKPDKKRLEKLAKRYVDYMASSLLKYFKQKYAIKDEIKLKLVQRKPPANKGIYSAASIFMDERSKKIKPVLTIRYFLKIGYSLEELKETICHELIHFLCMKHKKEKDPKKLRDALYKIDRMIDNR